MTRSLMVLDKELKTVREPTQKTEVLFALVKLLELETKLTPPKVRQS